MQDELWELMLETIQRRNEASFKQPWSISDFIGVAIADKIKKMGRSRRDRIEDVPDRVPDEEAGKHLTAECDKGEQLDGVQKRLLRHARKLDLLSD
jgi:hypothetical protein